MEARMQDYFESMENALAAIMDEGHDAHSKTIQASENPYAEGSWMARAWNEGWTAAAECATEDTPSSLGEL
jgi:hypothetical protein